MQRTRSSASPPHSPLTRSPLGGHKRWLAGWARAAGLVVIGVFLPPSRLTGDAGIPMLAAAWPVLWILFVPVIFAEAAFARRYLALEWRPSLRLSLVANLWSTLAGVPLTWLALLMVGASLGGVTSTSRLATVLLFPVAVVDGGLWSLCAAGAALCIPFGLASIWIEAKVGIWRLGSAQAVAVKRWSWLANGTTYVVLMTVLACFAWYFWLTGK